MKIKEENDNKKRSMGNTVKQDKKYGKVIEIY